MHIADLYDHSPEVASCIVVLHNASLKALVMALYMSKDLPELIMQPTIIIVASHCIICGIPATAAASKYDFRITLQDLDLMHTDPRPARLGFLDQSH